MGIKGLFQLLEKEAPNSFRMIDIKVFTGKIVCCDASNVIYSFMATTGGGVANGGEGTFDLTDKDGNPTA